MSLSKIFTKRSTKHLAALTGLALAATLTACGSGAPGASADGTSNVRMQTYASGSYYLGYVTDKLGNFKKEGVNVEFIDVNSGTQAANGLLSGSLDMAVLNPFIVQPLLAQGQKLQVVSGYKGPNSPLIGSKEFTDTSWPKSLLQLKGKTIGVVALGGTEQQLCQIALRGAGLANDDYTFVATGTSQGAGAALENGNTDAACLSDAPAAALVADGFPRLFSFTDRTSPDSTYTPEILAIDKHFSYSQVWAKPDWATNNAETVTKIRTAMAETIEWMNDPANLDELISILTNSQFRVQTLSEEEFAKYVEGSIKLNSVVFSQQTGDIWMKMAAESGKGDMPPVDTWVNSTTPATQADVDQLLAAPPTN